MTDLQRQVLDAAEVAALIGMGRSTVLNRVKQHGHVLGVRPIPDVGRRVLFSRVLVERALHGEGER